MRSSMLLWEEDRKGEWSSQCGRYRLVFRQCLRPATGVMCLVYFYGSLAHRETGISADDLRAHAGHWCADHRARMLPRIVEFESWAAGRYGIDLRWHRGPLSRRDAIKVAISERGDWLLLGLPLLRDLGELTIGQAYRLLYESIGPEPT